MQEFAFGVSVSNICEPNQRNMRRTKIFAALYYGVVHVDSNRDGKSVDQQTDDRKGQKAPANAGD
jgi:hypothetical protein